MAAGGVGDVAVGGTAVGVAGAVAAGPGKGDGVAGVGGRVGGRGALVDDGFVFGLGWDNVAAGVDDLGELGFRIGFDRVAEVGEDAGREDVEGEVGNVAVGRVAGCRGGTAGAGGVFADLAEEGLLGVEPVRRIWADAVGFYRFDATAADVVARRALTSLSTASRTKRGRRFIKVGWTVRGGVGAGAGFHKIRSTFAVLSLADELAASRIEFAILAWADQREIFVRQKTFGLEEQLSGLHEGLSVVCNC